jgi:hypothetical protein
VFDPVIVSTRANALAGLTTEFEVGITVGSRVNGTAWPPVVAPSERARCSSRERLFGPPASAAFQNARR